MTTLVQPSTAHSSTSCSRNQRSLYVSKATLQGRRPHQEDRIFTADLLLDLHEKGRVSSMDKCNRLLLFAVCDGHKGDKAAQFFCDNVVNAFWEATVEIEGKEGAIPLEDVEKLQNSLKTILNLTIELLDKSYLKRAKVTKEKDGSCVTALLVLNNHMFFCNLGDCRSLRINKGRITQITRDHQPGLNSAEDKRVLDAGAKIDGSRTTKRVVARGMRMAITRALGDRLLKPSIIISKPDIFYFEISSDLSFVILCSDGVTSRVSNKKILEIISKKTSTANEISMPKKKNALKSTDAPKAFDRVQNLAKELCDFAYTKAFSLDNISALVVKVV